MIRKFLPILLLLPSAQTFAQAPILNWGNISPVVHDTFATVVCDTAGINQGLAGTNITWTYSGLTPSTVISPNRDTAGVAYFGPSDAGYSALLAASSLASATATFNASTYAIETNSGMGTTYEQTTATQISQTAVYVNSGDLAVYSNPMDLLRLPFTYGNTYTDTFAGAVLYTPTGLSPVIATESGTVTVNADGYGTLVLPGPTIYSNVLRVHSSQLYRDSANLFGTPLVESYDLETYTWYQPGYHSPLLTIAMASGSSLQTKTVSYAARQIANHDAVPVVSAPISGVQLVPNPASNAVGISFVNNGNGLVQITIEDMNGRTLAQVANMPAAGLRQVTYDTRDLAAGTYFVCVRSGSTISRTKLVVVH